MLNINNDFYQNSMINMRKDDDDWSTAYDVVSDSSNKDEVHFSIIHCMRSSSSNGKWDAYSMTCVNNPINADYVFPNSDPSIPTGPDYYTTLLNPVKSFDMHGRFGGFIITFTPSEDFDGVYLNGEKVELTGDSITPGDGMTYILHYQVAMTTTFVIAKTATTFMYSIEV